jgi:exoribonuclease-2
VQLLYEEDGELKVGAVLDRAPASYHVESPHGRRSKIKAANVLLSFERPPAAELLAAAGKFAGELEVGFLWECSGAREFGFEELAREYVGREPTPVEAAGVLMKLHGAPMYFYRRGRGRFQAAPEATLKLALAAAEKKKRVQEQVSAWAEALARGDCPAEIAALQDELLYAPDRNKPQTKALEQACAQTGLAAAKLFAHCGRLGDSHEFHLKRFLHEFFPGGAAFPAHEVPALPEGLPRAPVAAFSLDDIGTTEIDDAFSVQRLADGVRVGIHIAAPALGFAPGSPLDAIARERLSTAYMPGRKFTMLPHDVIARFSLDHGGELPAVSLYLDIDEQHGCAGATAGSSGFRSSPTCATRSTTHSTRPFEKGETRGLPHEEELHTPVAGGARLWRRNAWRPSAGASLDYTFTVENDRVRIVPRKRGAPLDKLVSEMMIRRQLGVGRAPGGARRGSDLSRPVHGQGALQRARRGPRGTRRLGLRVDELAAAALMSTCSTSGSSPRAWAAKSRPSPAPRTHCWRRCAPSR